jgi:hypothetical protein
LDDLIAGPARLTMKDGRVLLGKVWSVGVDYFDFGTVNDTYLQIRRNDVARIDAAVGEDRERIKAYLTRVYRTAPAANVADEARDDVLGGKGPNEREMVWHLTPRGWERGHWSLPNGRMIWFGAPPDSLAQFHRSETIHAGRGWTRPVRRWWMSMCPVSSH